MAPKKPRRNGEVLAAGWLAHIGFLLSPVTVAAIAVLIWWYVPRHLGIMVAKRDEDVITNYHLPGLIVFHAIIAGFLLAKVLVGYSRMWISIRRDDEFAFREALEERIPKVAHLLLATLSVMVRYYILIAFRHHDSEVAGDVPPDENCDCCDRDGRQEEADMGQPSRREHFSVATGFLGRHGHLLFYPLNYVLFSKSQVRGVLRQKYKRNPRRPDDAWAAGLASATTDGPH